MSEKKLKLDRIDGLEVFVQIAESGSLTAAGTALGLSTPLISRKLATLEGCLGVRLIDRSSRMASLTSEGRELYPRAAALLQQLRETEAALAAKPGELSGTVRMSIPTAAVEMGLIADSVALFRKHANLSVEVYLSDRPVDVVSRGLDAALYLTDSPERHPGDVILGQHPTSLAAAPEYLERAGRPKSPQDLLAHRTIRAVSRRGTPSSWYLIGTGGEEVELPPSNPMYLSDDLRVSYAAVVGGAGIGRMPLAYIAKAVCSGELELVLPKWRFRPIMVAATLRRRGIKSSKMQALFELVNAGLERVDKLAAGSPLEPYYREQVAALSPPR
jgi:DNA-binding transcriptional LysR family regulator